MATYTVQPGDTLSKIAGEQLGDPGHSLAQLSKLLKNCVSCHAVYRIDAVMSDKH